MLEHMKKELSRTLAAGARLQAELEEERRAMAAARATIAVKDDESRSLNAELASSKENFRDYTMRTKVEFERGCLAVAAENEERCAQALAELRRVHVENAQLRRVIESTPTRPDEWQECNENSVPSRVQRISASTPGAPQQSQTPPRCGSAIFEEPKKA